MQKKRLAIFTVYLSFFIASASLCSIDSKKTQSVKELKCIATKEWAPFNLVEDGRLVGIGLDYWQLIQEKSGLSGNCALAENWIEVLDAIKNRTADLTIATQETPDRLIYASFSKPYATYPIVVITKNDAGFIDDISLLHGKTIAIGKQYAVSSIIKNRYPNLKFISVESIDKALRMVSRGQAFATLDILPVAAYKINRGRFSNLKISGSIKEVFGVSIMIRSDYKHLLPSINKAIDSITEEERDRINKKWVYGKVDQTISKRYFYILISISGGMLLFFATWLYLLKREIRKKDTTAKQLKELVTTDSLTGACNRYMFDWTLDKEISMSRRHGYPLSLIFFDIDGFKNINDGYGHRLGDMILRELATLVGSSIRSSDTFCRWGGDEFIIILHNTKERDAQKIAKNLDQAIRLYRFSGNIQLSCSFGITELTSDDNHDTIMARVDKLLYRAKTQTDSDGNILPYFLEERH